ncbi:MAG: LysR family transcriptional regulator [Hyphomicrobiaceae bacterium]
MLNASLRRLSVFKVVVEAGGVNAAAELLEISQPSVTAHVSALEKEIATPLFVRARGRRNRLSPVGQAVYSYACDVVVRSEDLLRAIGPLKGHAAERISIAVQRTIANNLVPSALAGFLERRPEARITVRSETQETVLDLVRKGAVDAGILFSAGRQREFRSRRIGTQQLVFVCAPAHPLAGSGRVPIDALACYGFVGGLRSSQFFSLVDEALRKSGLSRFNVIVEMQDSVAVKNAAMHGLGIACTLLSVVGRDVEQGRLALIETEPYAPQLDVHLVLQKGSNEPALLSDFVPHLQSKMRGKTRH